MNPLLFVPVEGALARPRLSPLDGVPFGREWMFRGTADTQSGRACLARLTTACIDVEAPHRACRWQPPGRATPAPVKVDGQPVAGTVAPPHVRRATRAACWTIGSLGVIGWLIAAHEPPAGLAPRVHTAQTSAVMLDGGARSAVSPVAVAGEQVARQGGTTHPSAAQPDAKTDTRAPATHTSPITTATQQPAVPRDEEHVATAPPPRASTRRATASARHSAPLAVTHVAARGGPTSPATRATPRRTSTESRPSLDAPGTLDDPRTLIAMANALRAGTPAPAQAKRAPTPDFDWTARLSHRRLTDAPDAFTR